MNLLIIGGSGFLGESLITRAIQKNWKIISVSRKKKLPKKSNKNIKYIFLDLSDYRQTKKLKKFKFDYVINSGGYVNHDTKKDMSLNIINNQFLSLVNLIDVLDTSKLKKFIQLGSSEENIEYSNKNKFFLKNKKNQTPYSFSKTISTEYLLMMNELIDFPVTIFKVHLVYGPGQKNNRLIPYVIKNCILDKEFNITSGNQIRDMLYIEDFLNVIFKSLKIKKINGKVYDLGSGKGYTVKTLVNLILKKINKGKPRFGALNPNRLEIKKMIANIKKLKKDLNWKPQHNINCGLLKTIEYYKNAKE